MNSFDSLYDYEQKKQHLATSLTRQPAAGIRLVKENSNLFRQRKAISGPGLNVRDFNKVIRVAPAENFVEVEGMTSYEALTRECLKYGVMPAVVPQLTSITVGGAVTGIGIESSSFKYGLVHETLMEMDILLAEGNCITCSPDNEHKDLFYGFPNSYGTLGYALKLKILVVPVKPYVHLTHIQHREAEAYFADITRCCQQDIDFIDGTIFSPGEYYLTIGKFINSAPYTSDYTYKNIYYRSIRKREEDFLNTVDYIWRWDTDWFWCSQYFFAQNPLVRRLLGPGRLNSVTYTKFMNLNRKYKITDSINNLLGWHSEAVIQDVEIPIKHCPEFLDFYFRNIKFTPIWTCPIHPLSKNERFPLYPLDQQTLYINFGFWNTIKSRNKTPPGYYNKLVEQKVFELGGIKSLYSDAYYSTDQFWEIYNREEYFRLKNRYDPQAKFKDLYAKCVGHQ